MSPMLRVALFNKLQGVTFHEQNLWSTSTEPAQLHYLHSKPTPIPCTRKLALSLPAPPSPHRAVHGCWNFHRRQPPAVPLPPQPVPIWPKAQFHCRSHLSNISADSPKRSDTSDPPRDHWNCLGRKFEYQEEGGGETERQISAAARLAAEKLVRKKSERITYLVAAVMSSLGVTSMAVMAVYYRFYWQMEGGEIPCSEMFGTFALSVGAAVGMEFWARWAHRALWHASLWHMHESHHRPREGPFELNGRLRHHKTRSSHSPPLLRLLPQRPRPWPQHNRLVSDSALTESEFAGLGITVFGMAYMFVHDGLVHKRFPVGPIANVPYFRRVAAAHQLHHSDKFQGVPYGLFLGPKYTNFGVILGAMVQEVEEVGGLEELEKEVNRRIKLSNRSR
ncbi:unnamed protein product [Thlaspi arvense]|uniref:beta-carotene 3-hydroxylase n=1 Tax=Thlaspi arvense TaxID=13288 RepID=A0AAU9TA81_THLAR|nr:unnamed protein product [Thlaspi arvense]